MARRRTKAKQKRSRKPAFNLMNAAQTYANTYILTTAAFRVSPIQFFTGQQTISGTTQKTLASGQKISQAYSMTGYMPELNGTAMTLPELLGIDKGDGTVVPFGGSATAGFNFTQRVKENIRLNGGYMVPVVQTIGVNVGFAVAKKLLSKQRRGINKVFKIAGLRKDVMV